MEILAGAHSLAAVPSTSRYETTTDKHNHNRPPIDQSTMRRISRLRTPAVAGFCPSSAPIAPLRAPIPSSTSTLPKHTSSPIRLPQSQTRRHLSTTPARSSDEALLPEETTPAAAEEFKTALVYPSTITDAAAPSAVTDASYIPAETADGLEEVGGLADWWEDPSHGATSTVRATARPFGPADGTKVLDPAVLEVLARRAVIEALVVGRFVSAGGNQGKKVDQLFAGSANPEEGLQRIVKAEVVVGEEGTATLGDFRDWQRVWDLLRFGVKRQGKKEGVEAVEAAAAPGLTPELATELVQSWGMGWRKAELRDPVIKFFVSFSDVDATAFSLQITNSSVYRLPSGSSS
jgi:hypothetical protein